MLYDGILSLLTKLIYECRHSDRTRTSVLRVKSSILVTDERKLLEIITAIDMMTENQGNKPIMTRRGLMSSVQPIFTGKQLFKVIVP